MRRQLTSCILLIFFAAFLILKDEVIAGASEGLLLWYRSVLPSLLPFMILVSLMIHTGAISFFSKIAGPLMRWFPGASPDGSFAVAAGFLCGYPMGAKVSADLVSHGNITSTEGAWLLSFCNNTSPMFILGILLTGFITDENLKLPFFLILILAPVFCGQIFRCYYTRKSEGPFRSRIRAAEPSGSISLTEMRDSCLMDSFSAIGRVGLYMLLCSIFIQMLNRIFPGSGIWKNILLSSMEVTTGLSLLAGLDVPVRIRYILLMASVSFGGFCAVFQTASMIRGSGLKLGPYIAEKLVTAAVTSLLTYLFLTLIYR